MPKLGVLKLVTDAFVIVESNKDQTKLKTEDSQLKSKLCVCMDPSNLNKAITREPYYYHAIEDVIPELSNARLQ